jgi:hypothetical protein
MCGGWYKRKQKRRDGDGNWNFANGCEGGRMEVGRNRDPDPRHKGARLSESAGKKEEKDDKARPEQVAEHRRTQKNKGGGPHQGVFWPVDGAIRCRRRCRKNAMLS